MDDLTVRVEIENDYFDALIVFIVAMYIASNANITHLLKLFYILTYRYPQMVLNMTFLFLYQLYLL